MNFGLLVPLGLIALITIPVLILIYIIRPNYQVKHLSSTYIWQLSLKYKKRRIPINKLRNILLFLCQLLILTAISLIIARPALIYDRNVERSDVIVIIDSSASMYTKTEGVTRFSRAVEYAEDLAVDTLSAGGAVSVILADDDPEFLVSRLDSTRRSQLMETFETLKKGEDSSGENSLTCSYGKADIEAALRRSEDILAENPTAKIYLYTDTTYEQEQKPKNVYINRVANSDEDGTAKVFDTEEWNAAILDVEAEFIDGAYQVTVEVACYCSKLPSTKTIEVSMQVSGANANLSSQGEIPFTVTAEVDCIDDTTSTLIFCSGGGTNSEKLFYHDLKSDGHVFTSYESIIVSIDEGDSFDQDNNYQIYGGRKERLNLLYSSDLTNPFFSSALDVLRARNIDAWDIRVTESRHMDNTPFETTGYDFYIYEGVMPDVLPADGVVFLMDPDKVPAGAGFSILDTRTYSDLMELSPEEEHPLMKNIVASNIHVTRYRMISTSADYHVLMSCESNPLFLVRDEGNCKIVLMPFSVHYSDLGILTEWYTLLSNILNYFMPRTVAANSFEVGEKVEVNPRGPSLTVYIGEDETKVYTREEGAYSFTVPLVFNTPGMYEMVQDSYFDENYRGHIKIFIKIPVYESNIWAKEAVIPEPLVDEEATNSLQELLVWFAAALVTLLFVEWFLHSRENK